MRGTSHPIALGAAVMAGLLAGPEPASGGTVKVRSSFPGERTVEFVAAAGERNAVAVAVAGDPFELRADVAWAITDTGAPLTAGDGCVAVDASTARCSAHHQEISAFLGDRDDRFFVTASPFVFAQVRGGGGDDRISGTHGGGVLDGERGDDRNHRQRR